MFGYIKPFKPEMKVKEFEAFKAVYCGLCKQLSHVYGPFASLTLSYDFTFIATISLGLSDECTGFKRCSCVANPLRKKPCLLPCDDLNYCASAAMLMIYYKLRDDIEDSGFFKKIACYLLLPFAAHARKKAAKLYPETDTLLAELTSKQSEVERGGCESLDRAADPTANALALLCEPLSKDTRQKQVLHRFGYLLGRYVYFADALDDLEEDQKSNSYNPFLKKFTGKDASVETIKQYAQEVLNLTMGEIAPAYELLDLKRYKSILDNIVYLGLRGEVSLLSSTCKSCRKKNRNTDGLLMELNMQDKH